MFSIFTVDYYKLHFVKLLGLFRFSNEDANPAYLGDVLQGEVGRPLQPQQGPHEVLPGRKQVKPNQS